MEITAQQRQYILDHIDDRPRAAVARAAGVSIGTVYRIVRRHGGQLLREWSVRSPEAVEAVRKLYPTTEARKVARAAGISKSTVLRIAAHLGLRHDEATQARIEADRARRLDEARSGIDRQAAARKRKATLRLEYYRQWEGKPRRTKLRLRQTTNSQKQAIWYLCKKWGYFHADGDPPLVLCYDSQTRRSPNESALAARHGLTFVQADE